jgi:hypothetical protein
MSLPPWRCPSCTSSLAELEFAGENLSLQPCDAGAFGLVFLLEGIMRLPSFTPLLRFLLFAKIQLFPFLVFFLSIAGTFFYSDDIPLTDSVLMGKIKQEHEENIR